MKKKLALSIFIALFSLAIVAMWGVASTPILAHSSSQDATPTPESIETQALQDCQECHLDIASQWLDSPHAHAFDDPFFQERWQSSGAQGDCLTCHTTNYQHSSGEYEAEGVACQACHGEVDAEHPPSIVPIQADTDYCGSCHTTTLGEWRLTGHGSEGIGCMDCHDPHSQGALFEVADEMCLNCHKDNMGNYLEDLHIEKGIGCVDCHALVIPPEVIPEDGIVPTGHAFTITPATCVACHTDTLHAGFTLPGYEDGAKAANGTTEEMAETVTPTPEGGLGTESDSGGSTPEQQIQALEVALANRNVTLIFQGGIVGLVLGGTTAWLMANNLRRSRREREHEPATS